MPHDGMYGMCGICSAAIEGPVWQGICLGSFANHANMKAYHSVHTAKAGIRAGRLCLQLKWICRQVAQHQAERAQREDAVVAVFRQKRAARILAAWSAEAQHSRCSCISPCFLLQQLT